MSTAVNSMAWERGYATIEPQIDTEGIHRWPFDPLFPIDVRFFVLGGRGEVRMNRHDYLELCYIFHGNITFQIQQRYVTAAAGDLLVIGSTFFHRPIRSETSAKAIVLYFQPELLRAGDSGTEGIEYLTPFMAEDCKFSHLVRARTGVPVLIFDFMKRIHSQLPAMSGRARLTVKTYLKTILILLVNHYSELCLSLDSFRRKQDNIERLQPLFEIMNRSFANVITVQEAAASVYMSKSHFTRFFRKVTGQAFVTYLHHLRIGKAQTLLTSTERSIAEIGQDVGFCDQSYFGLIFHRLVGTTPRQYRNQLHNGGSDRGNDDVQQTQTAKEPSQLLHTAAQRVFTRVKGPLPKTGRRSVLKTKRVGRHRQKEARHLQIPHHLRLEMLPDR